MNVTDKIIGCFLGAAVGDAMGAATETRTIEMIQRDFGGYVKTIITPPKDCFIKGRPAGTVTDDFSLAYATAQTLLNAKRQAAALSPGHNFVTQEVANQCLIAWSENEAYFSLAGPTTRAAVLKLKGIGNPSAEESWLACDNHKATNGAAMKIFPIGLIHPKDKDAAIDDAITLCLPTHTSDAALSGSCAIACAVSEAMTGQSTMDTVIEAGLYGAHWGYKKGQTLGMPCACPSVEKRIRLAVDIGKNCGSWERALRELSDIIGTGISIAESVPCVFGILSAARSDPMSAIIAAVNIGNDTDTIATMAGAITGALYGVSNIPMEYMDLINRVNHYDIIRLALNYKEAFY